MALALGALLCALPSLSGCPAVASQIPTIPECDRPGAGGPPFQIADVVLQEPLDGPAVLAFAVPASFPTRAFLTPLASRQRAAEVTSTIVGTRGINSVVNLQLPKLDAFAPYSVDLYFVDPDRRCSLFPYPFHIHYLQGGSGNTVTFLTDEQVREIVSESKKRR